jgi:translation elongation factor EF-Tu-like GTPase
MTDVQVVVWILGHVGHGKRTLASALARRLAARGAAAPLRFVNVADEPLSPDCARAAILVVSAAEGPMPQTRDHLQAAKAAGVGRVVVFLSKLDAADRDLAGLVELEVRELLVLCAYPGDKAVVVQGSATRALADDGSDLGTPALDRLLSALGVGAPDDPNAAGGLGGFISRLFK